jgi:hypothetical protein
MAWSTGVTIAVLMLWSTGVTIAALMAWVAYYEREKRKEFHRMMKQHKIQVRENVWRLEFHDEDGMHWNLNDEEPPNTLEFRTVVTCTEDEFDEVNDKATAVWFELIEAHGKVDYLEFYKAMNS